MAEYTRCKTVRFTPEAWAKIEIEAESGGVTTSEYIRSIIVEAVEPSTWHEVLDDETVPSSEVNAGHCAGHDIPDEVSA